MYHDRGTKGQCTNSGNNHGYRDPSAQFRSILAYNCVSGQCDNNAGGGCPRVQRFSNTHANYNGSPIGNSANDNAQFLNNKLATIAGHETAMNCAVDQDCNDSDPGTDDTCNTAIGACVYTPNATPYDPVTITWKAADVIKTPSGIYSQFALDTTTPVRVADGVNYNGPDIYGGLDRANQGSWNVGTNGASGMRVRFEANHAGKLTAGLFLLKPDSPITFSQGRDTLSAPDIFTNKIERLDSATMRFVIEEAGQFYISELSPNFASGSQTGYHTASFSLEAMSANWFSYDPESSADSISVIGAAASPTFTDMGFVGFTLFATAAAVSDTRVNYGVRDLSITANTPASPTTSPIAITWDAAQDAISTPTGMYGQTSLNTVTPLRVADGTNYVGPDIYGALDTAPQGSWNVANNGGSGLRLRFESSNALSSVAGLFLLRPSNLISFSTDRDTLSASEIFTDRMQALDSATLRFVIEEGGQFFISAQSPDFAGGSGYTTDSWSLEALSASWFSYDPVSSANSVSAIGSAASPTFENIGFVGFTLFATATNDSNVGVNYGVRKLSVIANEEA